MNQRELSLLTIKVLLAWLALSGLALYFGESLIKGLFPFIKAAMILMMPELAPSLKLVTSIPARFDYSIELSAWVLRPIYLNSAQYIPQGIDLKSSAHLLHALVPLVIEGSILLVWPVQRWSQRLFLIVFGLLTAVLVVMAILPSQLLGQMEISFQEVASTGKNPRSVPSFVDWMVFCEMGGRWLLGVVVAWLCIQFQRWLLR